MPPDVATFLNEIRRARVLEVGQLEEVALQLRPRFPESRALASELIKRSWLTPYQANQLLQGRGRELLLGSYVLLERIGEGGMGAVFKARNWKLDRVVALKLIRKERLDNPDAVRRFHREIRAAAQLDHPNIVRALDADEVDGTHLLVMEYVPGTDLARLVKKGGPLPADKACDYCRQAAFGLQHASERGLVHRDIKPHNLLLTPGGVVKILDMGLARLDRAREDDEASSTMTREGTVMGTLDFIAPEQAMDSHTVDVRADLYSLGCTLYFLLTGRVPFPGGTAMEKLMRHQSKEPEPVERLRPGLSPAVAGVVRKLMAKRPELRYQTAAATAAALAEAAHAPAAPTGVPAAGAETVIWTQLDTPSGTTKAAPQPPARRPPWVLIGAFSTAALLVLGLAAFFLVLPRQPAPTSAPANPPPAAAPRTEPAPPQTAPAPRDVHLHEMRVLRSAGPSLTCVSLSADGRFVLFGGFDGVVRLADLTTDRPPREFRGHTDVVWSAALSADGKLALSGSQDRSVRFWDVDGGVELRHFATDGTVSSVRFSPDGRTAAATCWDSKVRLWEAATGREGLVRSYDFPILDIAFTPDGGRFLLGDAPGTPLLCDGRTGDVLRTFVGHTDKVHNVACSPNGKQAASAGHDGALRVWNVATGDCVQTCIGHAGIVNEVRFLPDGKRIVSCGDDRTIRLWDVETGKEIAKGQSHLSGVRGLAVAADGRFAVTAGFDGFQGCGNGKCRRPDGPADHFVACGSWVAAP